MQFSRWAACTLLLLLCGVSSAGLFKKKTTVVMVPMAEPATYVVETPSPIYTASASIDFSSRVDATMEKVEKLDSMLSQARAELSRVRSELASIRIDLTSQPAETPAPQTSSISLVSMRATPTKTIRIPTTPVSSQSIIREVDPGELNYTAPIQNSSNCAPGTKCYEQRMKQRYKW